MLCSLSPGSPHPALLCLGRVMSHQQAGLWTRAAGSTSLLCLFHQSLFVSWLYALEFNCVLKELNEIVPDTHRILSSICASLSCLLHSLSSANWLSLLFTHMGRCPPNLNINSDSPKYNFLEEDI